METRLSTGGRSKRASHGGASIPRELEADAGLGATYPMEDAPATTKAVAQPGQDKEKGVAVSGSIEERGASVTYRRKHVSARSLGERLSMLLGEKDAEETPIEE